MFKRIDRNDPEYLKKHRLRSLKFQKFALVFSSAVLVFQLLRLFII